MANEVANAAQNKQLSVPREWRNKVSNIASSLLTSWVGEERSKEAVGRTAAALSASAASAKDPRDFYSCTPESIGTVIAVSALTGIMPSTGAAALAYAVPQRPRANEPPALQYMLSHRGLNALAARCDKTMIAVPIGHDDEIEVQEDNEVKIIKRDVDNPPATIEELRGVVLIVKSVSSGTIITKQFVPKSTILKRKQVSRSASSSYSPWATWPIEMAMKTAMHYAVSRGWCVIDDTTSVKALSVESDMDLHEQRPQRPTLKGIASQVQEPTEPLGDETIDVEPEQMESADLLEPVDEPQQSEPAKPADNSTPGLLKPFQDLLDKCSTVSEIVAVKEKAQKDLPPPVFDIFVTHIEAKKSMIKKK